ncbi:hypothetical protein [Streptomyces sp. RFCAC02]|uniref:hypothetical protein n=1 Tax=Streptomyces sp. RFCAC02 TaxID=2499143 RepID=UPI001020EF7E|nr:hypothetical protein [Streptomyces sp. RFCAC02]
MAEIDTMVKVLHTLESAAEIFTEEEQRLRRLHGEPHDGEATAGSPQQTLIGIRSMVSSTRHAAKAVATAIGYTLAGSEERTRAVAVARTKPICVPSGLDRMGRPIGPRTVQALRIMQTVSEWFEDNDLGTEIEVCLAAPDATYPPSSWTSRPGKRTLPPPSS